MPVSSGSNRAEMHSASRATPLRLLARVRRSAVEFRTVKILAAVLATFTLQSAYSQHAPLQSNYECEWHNRGSLPVSYPFASIAFDTEASSVYVYGGFDAEDGLARSDVTVVELAHANDDLSSGVVIKPLRVRPSASRFGAAGTFRPAGDDSSLVFIGGADAPGHETSDLILYNPKRGQWRVINPGGFAPRAFAAAVWARTPDGLDFIVLSGGGAECGVEPSSTEYSCKSAGLGSHVLLPNGDGFLRHSKSPPGTPGALYGHTVVFDSKEKRLLAFGGTRDGTRSENFVYSLDLSQDLSYALDSGWRVLTTEAGPAGSPPRLAFHTAVFDTNRNWMVVHGGLRELGATSERVNSETWLLDLHGEPPRWQRTDIPNHGKVGGVAAHSATHWATIFQGGREARSDLPLPITPRRPPLVEHDLHGLICSREPPTPETPECPDDGREGVYLYDRPYFRGGCYWTDRNVPRLRDTPLGDDRVRSVCALPEGDWRIYLFRDERFQGDWLPIKRCEPRLDTTSLADDVSSAQISQRLPPPPVRPPTRPPPTDTPTPTATATQTPEPSPTPTRTASATPTDTTSPTITATPSPTPTATEDLSVQCPEDREGVYFYSLESMRGHCRFAVSDVARFEPVSPATPFVAKSVCAIEEPDWVIKVFTQEDFRGASFETDRCVAKLQIPGRSAEIQRVGPTQPATATSTDTPLPTATPTPTATTTPTDTATRTPTITATSTSTAIPTPPLCPHDGREGVYFYSERGFLGMCIHTTVDEPTLSWSPRSLCMIPEGGWAVTLFTRPHFEGNAVQVPRMCVADLGGPVEYWSARVRKTSTPTPSPTAAPSSTPVKRVPHRIFVPFTRVARTQCLQQEPDEPNAEIPAESSVFLCHESGVRGKLYGLERTGERDRRDAYQISVPVGSRRLLQIVLSDIPDGQTYGVRIVRPRDGEVLAQSPPTAAGTQQIHVRVDPGLYLVFVDLAPGTQGSEQEYRIWWSLRCLGWEAEPNFLAEHALEYNQLLCPDTAIRGRLWDGDVYPIFGPDNPCPVERSENPEEDYCSADIQDVYGLEVLEKDVLEADLRSLRAGETFDIYIIRADTEEPVPTLEPRGPDPGPDVVPLEAIVNPGLHYLFVLPNPRRPDRGSELDEVSKKYYRLTWSIAR